MALSFFVDQTQSRLGARESLSDVARNLERWIDGVVLRTFAHETVTEMAKHASIPVINALSELEHPCQAMADMQTLQEQFGDLHNVRLAYVGDGNNVAHSLMLAAASLGASISVATPEGYEPDADDYQAQRKNRGHLGFDSAGWLMIRSKPCQAPMLFTPTFGRAWDRKMRRLNAARYLCRFQVNQKLFSRAAKHAVFMHCLPAHRGDEVAATVIDSPRSVVFDQAENRLHIQKAI